MGNVVGSNIANLLLVLAVGDLITPRNIDSSALHIDDAAMMAAAVALRLVTLNGVVMGSVAALLVWAMLAYLTSRWWTLSDQEQAEEGAS